MSQDAVFLIDLAEGRQGEIVAMNHVASVMHGYELGEFIGKRIQELDDPQTASHAAIRIKQVLAGESLTFEGKHLKKDGSVIPMSVTACKITLNNKDYILAFDKDVSSLDNAQQIISFKENKLTSIINSLSDGVIAIDAFGIINKCNRVAQRIFENEESSVTHHAGVLLKKIGFIDNLDAVAFVEKFTNPISANFPVELLCKQYVSSEGLTYIVTVTPIITDLEFQRGVVLVIKDETESIYLESQLHQAQKMQSIGQLVGGIAHDFNNILGAIVNSANTLKLGELSSDEAIKLANVILASSSAASSMIKRLLAFSNDTSAELIPINLSKVVQDSLALFKRANENEVLIETHFSSNERLIFGDPFELQSAVLNLLVNAERAIKGKGKITISTGEEIYNYSDNNDAIIPITPGPYVCLVIKDNGIGISKKNIHKIFEPYYSTQVSHKGVGLGLAMVYGTLKRHKGSVVVESVVGVGSEFKLYFPLHVHAIQPNELSTNNNTLQNLRGSLHLRILSIGGDEVSSQNLKEELSKWRCEFIQINTVLEAVRYYQHNLQTIDVVLIDTVLVDGSAFQCFSALQAINSKIKVIILGHSFSEEEIIVYNAKNVYAILNKPFVIMELITLLAGLVAGENMLIN